MTKSDLIKRLARRLSQVPARDAQTAVGLILDAISAALVTGRRVELRGFGVFSAVRQAPRSGRNPKTGEALIVPAKGRVHYKPGGELRERVNKIRRAAAPEPGRFIREKRKLAA